MFIYKQIDVCATYNKMWESTWILSIYTQSERVIANQNKSESHDKGHVYIKYIYSWRQYKISNAVEQHDLQTNDTKHIPWHTTSSVPPRVNGQGNFFSFLASFFSNDLL